MLYRTQVRKTADVLIRQALTGAGATVHSSKDTPVPTGTMPQVLLYTDDDKEGVGSAGAPTFRTMCVLTVEMIGEADTKEDAVCQAENINDVVEQALFGNPEFTGLFEKFDRVTTTTDYRGTQNRFHIAAATMIIEGHATEIFEPTITTELGGLNIYVDSLNVFDPNGTYTPPFNYPVPAPPRTTGPDGRVEIAAQLNTD